MFNRLVGSVRSRVHTAWAADWNHMESSPDILIPGHSLEILIQWLGGPWHECVKAPRVLMCRIKNHKTRSVGRVGDGQGVVFLRNC